MFRSSYRGSTGTRPTHGRDSQGLDGKGRQIGPTGHEINSPSFCRSPSWGEPGKRCGIAAEVITTIQPSAIRNNGWDLSLACHSCESCRALDQPQKRRLMSAKRQELLPLPILPPCAAGSAPPSCICQSNTVDSCRAAGTSDFAPSPRGIPCPRRRTPPGLLRDGGAFHHQVRLL